MYNFTEFQDFQHHITREPVWNCNVSGLYLGFTEAELVPLT